MAQKLLLAAVLLSLATSALCGAPPAGSQKVAWTPCVSPAAACDFFFYGYASTTPVITLNAVNVEKVASTALHYKSGLYVETASTSGGPSCRIIGGGSCGSYFFFRARGGSGAYLKFTNRADRLGVRPMPQATVDSLDGKCIKVTIDSASIKVGKGQNASVWLNPGDGNKMYPERRRCVVFKTVSAKLEAQRNGGSS